MKWLVLVLMMGIESDGARNTWIYLEPKFDNFEQCQTYVYGQAPMIRQHMASEYNGQPIDTIYCIQEDKLPKLLEYNNNVKGLSA
jgi:hypothetical protein